LLTDHLEISMADTMKTAEKSKLFKKMIWIIGLILVGYFVMATLVWDACRSYNYHKLDSTPARDCTYSIFINPVNFFGEIL
jgi:hypothetical protein